MGMMEKKVQGEEVELKKKMMTVFTIGVMSLSILGVPLLLKHKRKDRLQRSKEQLNNGKIHAVHTEEKAEKLGIETEGKEQITLEKKFMKQK